MSLCEFRESIQSHRYIQHSSFQTSCSFKHNKFHSNQTSFSREEESFANDRLQRTHSRSDYTSRGRMKQTAALCVASLGILSIPVTGLQFVSLPAAKYRGATTTTSLSLYTNQKPLIAPIASRRRSTMSMHMGHSHNHHTHEHDEQQVVKGSERKRRKIVMRKKRRRVALFLFATLAILGPPLVRNRAVARSDVAAFLLTIGGLTWFDSIRREVKYALVRVKNLKDGLIKHSSPITVKSCFKNENAADRVTLLGAFINLALSLGKFSVGVTCHSSALVADAGHSLSDLFSDFITLWAVQIGRLPPDEDHPYGHGKFEAVGSLFLSLTLLATGVAVGIESNKRLIEIISLQHSAGLNAASTLIHQTPTVLALCMAGLSIISKEWLYRITRNVGERINSQVVIANAWHHRSDAYSSILALISIGIAMFVPGALAADSAAGLLVAGMICMTGAEILGESIKQLTDTSNHAMVKKITVLAAKSDDVLEVTRVRARQVGSSAIVDVDVCVSDDLTASAALCIENRLKSRIMEEDGVVDVDVHATTQREVFCPLLETNTNQPSTTEIEGCVRDEILRRHPEIRSVEGVTVHYQDTTRINVDVDICVDPNASIAKATCMAKEVRKSLEISDKINKASIFLDLNERARVPL